MLRLAVLYLLLVSIVLCGACTQTASLPGEPVLPDATALYHYGFPTLAELGSQRASSDVTGQVHTGMDNFLQSSGASISGTDLVLNATSGGPGGGDVFEWAIWDFNLNGTPVDLQAELSGASASGAWIGLADYGGDRWEWHGPYTSPQTLDLAGGDWASATDMVYCAVVAPAGSAVTVVSVTYQSDSASQGGTILDSDGDTGWDTSMALVNGHPAIAYYDFGQGRLRYIRAKDAAGAEWEAPLTLDDAGDVGRFPSLVVVSGFPAIAYYDFDNETLKYIRAGDADGSLWGIGQTLESGGEFNSLAMVGERPAITHYDYAGTLVSYIRASNAEGTAWPADGVAVEFVAAPDGEATVEGTSLAVVNGKPAAVYFSYLDSRAYYRQADDADGTAWTTPHVKFDADNDQQHFSVLSVVDGMPMVAFRDVFANSLCICRATEANGFTWAARQELDNTADTGYTPSIAIVDGKPAIAYYENFGAGDLRYIRASDASGASWPAGQTLDGPGDVGAHCSLIQLPGGGPAVSYLDVGLGDLRYLAGF